MCHCTRELADAAKRQEYCHKVIAKQKAELAVLRRAVSKIVDTLDELGLEYNEDGEFEDGI